MGLVDRLFVSAVASAPYVLLAGVMLRYGAPPPKVAVVYVGGLLVFPLVLRLTRPRRRRRRKGR